MKTGFYCCLLILIMPFLLIGHALYISVSEIVYEADHSITITIKLFTNDLKDAIHNQHGDKIISSADRAIPEKYLEQYIISKFNITINGEAKTMQLVKQTTEADATWCTLKISDVGTIQTLAIQNKLLTELFSSQTNIVRINYAGEQRFLKLDKAYFQDEVKF